MTSEEPSYDEFHRWVGICITQWARIESKLFRICHFALQTNKQVASVVFFRTPTFDARLTLVDELMRAAFPKTREDGGHDHPLVIEYENLVRDMRPLWETRNILAHGAVSGMGRGNENWIEIHKHVQETWRPRKSGRRGAIRHSELEDYSLSVGQITDRIITLMHSMKEVRPPR